MWSFVSWTTRKRPRPAERRLGIRRKKSRGEPAELIAEFPTVLDDGQLPSSSSKKKESTDLLAKIVNEVLFTESEAASPSQNSYSPQFTFASQPQANSTTILRPFFDTSQKFLVSLTRTINQPTTVSSQPQMLLVNNSTISNAIIPQASLVTTSSTSSLSLAPNAVSSLTNGHLPTETPKNKQHHFDYELNHHHHNRQIDCETKQSAKAAAKKVAAAEPEKPEKVAEDQSGRKRSSSRLSVKKNEQKPADEEPSGLPNSGSSGTAENEKAAPALDTGKRKRRKKNKVIGESILLDLPSSSSSSSSLLFSTKKSSTKRKTSVSSSASSSTRADGYDSATDCEEEPNEPTSNKKKIKVTPKCRKTVSDDKGKKANERRQSSSNRVTSSTSEDDLFKIDLQLLDDTKAEISSSTDRIKSDSSADSGGRKKKKKVANDYVKRRRSKASSLLSKETKETKKGSENGLLNDIWSTINNVVAKGIRQDKRAANEEAEQAEPSGSKKRDSKKELKPAKGLKGSKKEKEQPQPDKKATRGVVAGKKKSKEAKEVKDVKEPSKEKGNKRKSNESKKTAEDSSIISGIAGSSAASSKSKANSTSGECSGSTEFNSADRCLPSSEEIAADDRDAAKDGKDSRGHRENRLDHSKPDQESQLEEDADDDDHLEHSNGLTSACKQLPNENCTTLNSTNGSEAITAGEPDGKLVEASSSEHFDNSIN
ncbi:hypothetical protein L1887_52807 [Cichorium endivia]|nr:hypothetical protein L1887_52807 [Cichorium endivia]